MTDIREHITQQPTITRFYKYQPLNEDTINGLKTGTLWCADPSSFNDPFELRLKQLTVEELSKLGSLDKLRRADPDFWHLSDYEIAIRMLERFKEWVARIRIISFTERNNSVLMWGHYARNHTGICLGFQVSDPGKEGLYKVNYADEYPDIDLANIWNINGTAKIFLTKSSDWTYEREWRKLFVKTYNFYSRYPGHLVEIILGAKIAKSDEDLMRALFTDSGITIRKAALCAKNYDLLIE